MSATAAPVAIRGTADANNLFSWSGTVMLRSGPTWNSFEDFRRQGNSALEAIPASSAATLNTKAGTFRILREPDFQHLVELATEACRLRKGMRFIYRAARVAQIHADQESIELLIESFSLISHTPEPRELDADPSLASPSEEFDPGDVPRSK